jgi:hypothetical protein
MGPSQIPSDKASHVAASQAYLKECIAKPNVNKIIELKGGRET